jgi:6-phosphofructokinase 1
MDPTAAPGSGGTPGDSDATSPTNTTVTLPPLTLRDVPRLASSSPAAAAAVPNPISRHPYFHPPANFYISPGDVSLRHAFFDLVSAAPSPLVAYRRGGPRRDLAVDPAAARAALVTCGGLCPGLNTVLRELVVGLQELYGVRHVFGVAAGYRGFYGADEDHVRLHPAAVDDWHKKGGTVLKTTRGGFDLGKIVDGIVARGYTQVRSTPRHRHRDVKIGIAHCLYFTHLNPQIESGQFMGIAEEKYATLFSSIFQGSE